MVKKIKAKKLPNIVICINIGSKYKFVKCHLTIKDFMGKPSLEIRREKKLGITDKIYKFINSHNHINLVICDSKNRLLSFSGGSLQSTQYGQDDYVTNTITFTSSQILSTDFSRYIMERSYKWYDEYLRETTKPDVGAWESQYN